MSSFPLYHQLEEQVSEFPDALTHEEKMEFLGKVKTMSDQQHEHIFVLIRLHGVINPYIIPYNGKHQKKGIKFDLDNLPVRLQHILLKFSTLVENQDVPNPRE